MPTHYTLEVTNNSTQFQDLCLFQKPVDLGVANVMALAWMAAPAWPNTTVTFTWTEDYSFVWAETGTLQPGITFKAAQSVAANPLDASENQIQFDYRNGAFTFVQGPVQGTPQLGSLYIAQLAGVPPGIASVGIGMAGKAVFAVQAQANVTQVYTPHPDYWITAGTFIAGQVLDVETIANDAAIPFQGTFRRSATLGPNGLWTVS